MNIKEYAKSLGIDITNNKDKPLNIEAGKAGYNQYLADIEAKAKAEKEAQDNETFFEKIGRYLGGTGAQDTSLSLNQGMNQAVEAYKNNTFNMRPSDNWTDEEKWAFGEKYAQNAEDAYKFAKQLNDAKAQEEKQKQAEALAKWSSKNGVNRNLASAASLGLNAVLGGVGYLDALAQKAAGREEIAQHNVLLPHEIANTMQGSVAQHLNEKYGTINEDRWLLGGKGLGDVYGLRMSIGQSALSGAMGGSVGTLVQFFGMSASQGVTDALERGATSDQALAYGTIAGLAEAIPEMISMDRLLGIASAEGMQNLLKNVLKQAGQEAGEEVTTSLINEVADRWIMGGKSNYQLKVNELLASGMSLKDAQNKAFTETLESIAFDALSGALSGGISGAGAHGFNRINQQFFQKEANETAKKALSPEASKLIEEAKKYDSTKKRAEALEKKVAEGKELTGYELRMLVSQLTEASRNADVDTVRKAIVEKMKSEGVSDSMAKTLGEIALNKAIGNEVSKVQDLMLKRNENALKVYNQISEEMMESGLGDSEWAQNTPIQRLRAEKRANEQPDTEQRVHSGIERLKADIAAKYGKDTREYKINMASIEGKFGEVDDKIVYKPSENSKIHVDGISSSLTQEDMIELAAIEKIANELGVDIHVYETTVDENGERTYVDKTGMRTSDSGFYDPSDNSIHIDLRAGENGEGTMLYTASHELVHFMKKNAPEHYAALEELVTKELVKGGFSIDQLVEEQRKKDRNGLTDEELREEVVAEACQSFLASKSAVAEIKALKTKNKGLWTSLKKFFTSLFNKINKVYKTVPPDSAEGKYIADMRKAVKPIRDAFMEGAVEAAKKQSQTKNAVDNSTANEEKDQIKKQARRDTQEDAVDKYKKRLDAWDGKTEGFAFVMGTTPQFLADLEINGAKIGKRQVRIDATKIKTILNDHSEMTIDVFKNLPDLLNDPIAILDSKTVKGRLVMIGEVYANGKPVTMVLEINPTTRAGGSTYVDVIKVASAYTRSNTQNLINSSNIRYVSENKDRVNNWLKVNRLQLPLPSSKINSVVDNSISQPAEKVNDKSKIRSKSRTITAKDSLGNELSAEQQEYFKDSKVRDENGNLLVVYHGSASEFTVFNNNKIGTHGTSHGHGFYFTENEGLASSYHKKGGQLLKGYLNIANPISEDKLTIKKNDLVKLIKAICEQEARNLVADDEYSTLTEALRDTFISNYVNTYGISLSEAYKEVADIIYPNCDNDTDVLGELFNSGARGIALEKVVEVLGYDGVIYTNPDGVHEYVAFTSNQFKNTTNKSPTKSADIRHKSRSYTSGQVAQMKANLSHQKVYSKSAAMKLVSEIAPNIRNRSFEALTDKLWKGLNTYTTAEDRRAFASDMAEMFIDKMMVDTVVKHRDWDAANEKLLYLKTGINSIKFRQADIPTLEYQLDKSGLRSLRARWGYKSKQGENKRAYGLDEFISDLSREMPGMSYLADMHPAEALVEVDKLYSSLKETIKEKYESAYEDAPDYFREEMVSAISTDIMRAFDDLGEESKMSKYISQRFKQYEERIEFWKAEHAKVKGESRWNGILATKAMHIRDLKKGTFYNATQYNPKYFKDSIEELSQIQWRGTISVKSVKRIMGNLAQWYTTENPMLYDKDAPNDVKNLYSDTISQYIRWIALPDTKFEVDERAMLYEVMNHLYTIMKNYNKVFRNGRWEDAPDLVKGYLNILEASNEKRNLATVVRDGYNRTFLEPMAIAKQADGYNPNGFYTSTMTELRKATMDASIGEMRLRKEYDAFIDKNKKYLMDAAKDTVNYRGFDIPKLHLISLYMTMKRDHARAGLAENGFEYTVKEKWWDSENVVKVPGYLPNPDGTNTKEMINAATVREMQELEKSFSDIDKQYIAILEKLFNVELKSLKVERDMERQGYTNATLDYYYPIMRGAIAENIDTARMSTDNRATNASFNENTVTGSKQFLRIISADAMVNRHIRDMCKYYYMSQAIENFNVLYNCDVSENRNNPRNISEVSKRTKVWEKDFEYFRKLINDMQGIQEPMTRIEKAIESLRGNYAKFALGLNAKVLATQFSSVIAAGNVIGFNSILNPKAIRVSTSDIETYCPLAAVRSYEKTALRAMSVNDKVDKLSETLSIGITVMDNLVINRLFASCQIEAQKRGDGEIGTVSNKISAGKILEHIILETQQNSYATERSFAMRSRNALLKSLTMFTADGMKQISRIHESVGELRVAKKSGDPASIKKARKKLARNLAVAACVAAYLSGISMVFNWIYDRDEEENKLLAFTTGMVGNFIGALPGISDLYDAIVNGFEAEDVTFDTINNLYGSISSLYKDITDSFDGSDDRSIEDLNRDLRSLLYGIGQVSGIPIRNLYNLTRGIVGNVSSKAGYYLDSKFYETALASDFKKSIESGNAKKTDYILGLLYGKRIGNVEASETQRKEVIRLAKEGYSVLPKDIPDKIKRNGVEYELSDTQKQALMEEYSKVIPALDKLMVSTFYSSKANKDRAYLIDYYHDKYYEVAVNKVLGVKDDKVTIYNAIGFNTYAKFEYVTRDIVSDKDKNGNTVSGSKKEKVIAAISKVSKDENKNLLYLASLGYSLTEAQTKKLCKYLNSLSVSASKKKSLAESCNLTYKNGKISP